MEEMKKEAEKKINGSGHVQVYDIVTSKDPSWQNIIYELIASEQLDPWDIDISLLCKGYFEKIQQMQEQNFFISSKILLAASLILRIKSEVLLNKYIKDIDAILFGKSEEEKKIFERITIDESELPFLTPKSPLPRFKKVTLDELMAALDNAIKTESRRINKEIEKKQRERLAYVDIPKFKRVNIKERIREIYARILTAFKHPEHKSKMKISYSHLTGNSKEEKISCFLPLLHLSNMSRLWLEQESHFNEIWIYMYEVFKKNFPDYNKDLAEEREEMAEELQKEMKKEIAQIDKEIKDEHIKRIEEINKDFENPLNDILSEDLK